jgi:hypothetical protein
MVSVAHSLCKRSVSRAVSLKWTIGVPALLSAGRRAHSSVM